MAKTFDTSAALARAASAAVNRVVATTPRAEPARVQLNVLLDAAARRKFKAIALAWGTSEREMIEAFIAQLPDVTPASVEAPPAVAWAKPTA